MRISSPEACFYLALEFIRKFSLLLDRLEDGGLPFFELRKVRMSFKQSAKLHFIHLSRFLFAIPGDKGDRSPFGK